MQRRLLVSLGLLLWTFAGCDEGQPQNNDADISTDSDPDSGSDGDIESDSDISDDADISDDVESSEDADEDIQICSDSDIGDAGLSSSRQTARPLGSTDSVQGFYEYLPPSADDGCPRPLLVFLHGIGENGDGKTELERVLNNGPASLIDRDEWPNERPFIVLSPQNSRGDCHRPEDIHNFIDFALENYSVDETRVYLTGLSCGAIGLWHYLAEHREEQIAAAVPIAGDGRNALVQAGCDLALVPIWAFHGDADYIVEVEGTTETIEALHKCPSPPRQEVLVTIYPDVGHDSWSQTYDLSAGHDIYSWMLRFTNP